MNIKEIEKKFKSEHPELFKLNPKVLVEEISEAWTNEGEINYDPPLQKISIKHPFIFDNRLIPENFNGINVENVIIGSHPKEFPSENESLPLEEWYSPKNYETFVANHLDLIRQKLNSSSMTEKEALDALTGDFDKHKKWYNELRTKRIIESENKIGQA